ncbi:hypothetical protein ACIBBE_35240 [Streptomyces sp. NPDC051644]|uniref:hypothetical protein n=1 Tax=Streptomyces sp. NPDC051644 TaxID=3365666 RepID=UPI0037A1702C
MTPEGYHRVRSHIRRNPTRRSAKRMSPWLIAGIAAVVVLWGQFFGFEAAAPAQPATPGVTATPSAGR